MSNGFVESEPSSLSGASNPSEFGISTQASVHDHVSVTVPPVLMSDGLALSVEQEGGNVLQEGGFVAPLLQVGPVVHPPLQATQLVPFHTSGMVQALHVGGLFAPFEQEFGAQLVPSHVVPDIQLAVAVFVSSIVLSPFFRSKTVPPGPPHTHTVEPEELFAVYLILLTFLSQRYAPVAFAVTQEADTIHVLAPLATIQLGGMRVRVPEALDGGVQVG